MLEDCELIGNLDTATMPKSDSILSESYSPCVGDLVRIPMQDYEENKIGTEKKFKFKVYTYKSNF